MDRGYFGFDLFNEINKTNNFFICRIRNNLDIINNNNNNKLNDYNVKINLSNLKTIRIIKYNINNNNYYLATNLENDINFNYESLINIYHRRWTIEEFFKLVKNSTNLKFNNEEDYIRINKSIYCYEIITKIMYLIKNYHESKIINKYVSNTKIKIVNKCFLMNYIFNYNFLFHFFNGTINNEYLNYQLIKGINIIYSNINRSNSRQCKRSNYLF